MKRNFDISHTLIDNPSNRFFYLHSHNSYEIFLFLSGDSKYVVEEKIHSLSPGDIIVIRKNQMHRIYHNSTEKYERIVFNILPEFFKEMNCQEYEQHFIHPENYIGNKIEAKIVRRSGLYDAIMRAKKYSDSFMDLDNPVLKSVITEILYLTNNIKSYSKDESKNSQLEAIIQYINQNFTNDIKLSTLEREFFISKYHLCHIFLNATGITVHQYINSKRITYATELISNGKNMSEAAIMAGFNNYPSFYRAFKKLYGKSPKNIQKK